MRTKIALLLALAAGLAAGCGSDDDQEGAPLPADAAEQLEAQLTSIENRFAAAGGACGDITGGEDPNLTAVENVLNSLPSDVDPDVRDSLEQSFQRLFELTDEQCDEQKGVETETEAEPPPVIETQPETETVPPEEEDEGDEEEEGDGEEAPPPTETTPVEPEPVPTETETAPEQSGGTLPPAQGDSALPDQGNGGGALVPEGSG